MSARDSRVGFGCDIRDAARERAQGAQIAVVRAFDDDALDYATCELRVVRVTRSRIVLDDGTIYSLRRSGRWVRRHQIDSVLSELIVELRRDDEQRARSIF